MKKFSGSISIYFVFAIVLIISVVMSVTEIARINCQKLYLQIATDSGLDSMASLYHRELYDLYNVYGVEYKTAKMLEKEYLSYIMPFFSDGEININNWYIARIDENNINLDINTLTDEDYFEKEIINYMKVKLLGKTISFLGDRFEHIDENSFETLSKNASSIFNEFDRSRVYEEVHERYFDFSHDIRELEGYAKRIKTFINSVNSRIESVKSMATEGTLTNGRLVVAKTNSVITDANQLIAALNNYKTKMNEFRKKVNESRKKYEEDRDSKKFYFTEDVIEFINDEFDRFISYVDENSAMNKVVEAERQSVTRLKDEMVADQIEIERFIVELESIEISISDERKNKGEDRDNDYIKELNDERKDLQKEFASYLRQVKESYKESRVEDIGISVSSKNHDEEVKLIDKLINYKNAGILNVVLDNNKLQNVDKSEWKINKFNILSNNNAIGVGKILLGEYELTAFNYFNKPENLEMTSSGSTNLEVERLIANKDSDLSNLQAVVTNILALRIAMNVLFIYTHRDKREMARSFTTVLFSGLSPLLAEAMFLVVLTAWGTAQALDDVKNLLDNKRVSFLHTNETWTISLDNLINVARGNLSNEERDNQETGFSYKDYLRLLLINTKQSLINDRMAGIIEHNLKKLQNNFDFNMLVYSFRVNNTFVCKHFFTNFVFIPSKDIELFSEYKIFSSGYRAFYD